MLRQQIERSFVLLVAGLCLEGVLVAQGAHAQLLLGGDISALSVLENNGQTYSKAGVTGDAISIMKSHGANSFRLRLFVNPTDADPIAVQDLAYTIDLAQRVKASGASLLLDIHYSDTWADPAHQIKPAAWSALSFAQLEQQVYGYTKRVMEAFDNAGALPEIVQIGNEISSGMLWDDGKLWRPGVAENVEFDNLATLLAAGINGARDGAPAGSEPSIMIHHDQGSNWGNTSYYFDRLLPRLQANGTDVDLIGYSYYPLWHNVELGVGGVAHLQHNLNSTVSTYNKPVVLVETGFAYTGAEWEPDYYEFDVSATGQHAFLQAMIDAVEAVPNEMGKGVYWWFPEAVPRSDINIWQGGRYGLFDENGVALPALEVFQTSTQGDFDLDGDVDAIDFLEWQRQDGSPLGLADWGANYGGSPLATATDPVPEPATFALLSFLLVGLLFHERSRSPCDE